ncbi:MAG: hypothetical protein ABI333_18010 [bacterium]
MRRATKLFIVVALSAAFAVGCGDDDPNACQDPCDSEGVGAVRCFGSLVQACEVVGDCLLWMEQLDCSDTGLLCMDTGNGPECGTLCTDQCLTGQEKCVSTLAQTCEADGNGCLRWVDREDCADATMICDDSTGDASCVSP